GYDPFSTNGYLPEFSLAASRTLLSRGPLSFAPGIAWGYGRSDATARGDPTSIEVHRLLVPLEGRLHVGRWGVAGYAFLRVAPGVAAQTATVEDASSPARFTATRWLFAGDVSAGYAYPFWARPSEGAHLPRAWIEADGGYGFVADRRLDLSAALPPGSSIRADGLDLGTVGLRGGFFRLALALSL
ncbi:MAG: hypothetical protein JOZ69_15305, partial [Myxococcales bacterium]|nr:hypothetical protein [Myxococcales bacterium]